MPFTNGLYCADMWASHMLLARMNFTQSICQRKLINTVWNQILTASGQGQNSALVWQGGEFLLCCCCKASCQQPSVSKHELQSPGSSPPKASLSQVFLERVWEGPTGLRTKFSRSCFSLKREGSWRNCCCCGGIDAEGMEKCSRLTWNREFLESMVRERGPMLPKHSLRNHSKPCFKLWIFKGGLIN